MQSGLDIVPGGGSTRPLSLPANLSGKFISTLFRPARLRGRFVITLFVSLFLVATYMLRSNTDHIKHYVTGSFSSSNRTVLEPDGSKWRSGAGNSSSKSSTERNSVHLIIPARSSSLELCKTLVSAAILNYPPPTLVGYDADNTGREESDGYIADALKFLLSKEVEDGDIAFIVDERTWFQLPAQVMFDRYEAMLRNSNSELLAKYGTLGSSTSNKTPQSKFTEKIIFGAEKSCIDHKSGDSACFAAPLSAIPKDIYGPSTDKPPGSSNNRPRYIYSPNMIGRVGDLRNMLQYVQVLLNKTLPKSSTQHAFSEIFGEQELNREEVRRKSLGPLSSFKEWLMRKITLGHQTLRGIDRLDLKNMTNGYQKNPDFGIGLDYSSSIFQVLDHSVDDIQFLTYNHPILVNSPSRLSASAFSHRINLPQDLNRSAPPFKLHSTPVQGPVSEIPLLEVDKLPINRPWTDVGLATNVVVPGTEIPCSLSLFGEGTPGLEVKWWKKMWYQPKARALMRRYVRSATGHIEAEAAEKGGEIWWDLRGGKGGIWTDKGQYLEWQEVCGKYDKAVFEDGMGRLGEEEGLGQPLYNKFGKLISSEVNGTHV